MHTYKYGEKQQNKTKYSDQVCHSLVVCGNAIADTVQISFEIRCRRREFQVSRESTPSTRFGNGERTPCQRIFHLILKSPTETNG